MNPSYEEDDHCCGSCISTPSNPVEASCCGRIFCWECLVILDVCACGTRVDPSACTPRADIQEKIDNVITKCPHRGCAYTTRAKFLGEHQKNCNMREVACPARGCKELVQYAYLPIHQKHCPYSDISCPYCERFVPPLDYQVHIENCEERPLLCKCGESYVESLLRDHVKVCELAEIGCPLASCDFKCARKDMRNHLAEVGYEHIQQLQNLIKQKDDELADKARTCCNLSLSNIKETILDCELVAVLQDLFVNASKSDIAKLVLFFLLVTILPLQFLIIRSLVFSFIVSGVWNRVMKPTLIRAKMNNIPAFGSILYILSFAMFMSITWKWLLVVAY